MYKLEKMTILRRIWNGHERFGNSIILFPITGYNNINSVEFFPGNFSVITIYCPWSLHGRPS